MHKKSLTSPVPVPTIGFVRCSNAVKSRRAANGFWRAAERAPQDLQSGSHRAAPQSSIEEETPCHSTPPNNSPTSTRSTSPRRQKIAALAIENAEKFMTLNLNAAKVVLANGAESAAAVAVGQGRARPDGAPRQVRRDGRRRRRPPTRSGLYEISSQAQAQFTALAEEAWSTYTKDTAAWVEKASKAGPGRLGNRRQRVQVDVRCLDRRVRPVPEGDEASREPGRCERPRRVRQCRQRRQVGDEGSQGCAVRFK